MRNPAWMSKSQDLMLGKILFKPRHVKSKDILFAKYKKTKKNQKWSKMSQANSIKPTIIMKSEIENTNQCLQTNGNLIFAYNYSILKINLKSMKISHKNFPEHPDYGKGVSICAIPNQKFFGIDFRYNSIFIINKNLKILERKTIEPKKFGTIIYLDGHIYLFAFSRNIYQTIEVYDLNKSRWKKAASLKQHEPCYYSILVTFEGQIITAPFSKGSVKAFDPFCNSVSKILKLKAHCGATLLVANDKLYCIQSKGYVFESLSRDYTQWTCISKSTIEKGTWGLPLYSFYNGSIYFVGVSSDESLYEFNLKTRIITFVDRLDLYKYSI